MYEIDQKQYSGLTPRLAFACLLLVATLFTSVSDATEAADTDTTAYVDSVHSWGTWALGIEPAAGPRVAQNVPMQDRSASIHFRPNDNATFSTVALPESTTPLPPVIPSIPTRAAPGSSPGTGTLPGR